MTELRIVEQVESLHDLADIVRILGEWSERASRGEYTTLAICGTARDGATHHQWARVRGGNMNLLLGAMVRMLRKTEQDTA